MTMVFSALQTALRSFAATPGQWLYLNQLVAPTELLIGKTMTTALNCLLVTWTSLALFSLWLGWPHLPEQMGQVPLWPFVVSLSLGAIALSSTLSFTAALASKIERGTGIMAVLSIPLLLPTLLIAVRASKLALLGEPLSNLYPNWAGEILMAGLPLALGTLLFPYLWRS
jgi:heme exporter protein B